MRITPSSWPGRTPLAVTLLAALFSAACGGRVELPGGGTTSSSTSATGTSGGATVGTSVGAGGGIAATTGSSGGGACVVNSDCGLGEIDHEILSSSDCPCLFGCPYLPMLQATIDRRASQYRSLCNPRHDGQGNPCPVDDCVGPVPVTCLMGVCMVAR